MKRKTTALARRVFVKPRDPKVLVAVPGSFRRRLHADGELVPFNAYWGRRLRDGDVVLVADASPEDLKRVLESEEIKTEAAERATKARKN